MRMSQVNSLIKGTGDRGIPENHHYYEGMCHFDSICLTHNGLKD